MQVYMGKAFAFMHRELVAQDLPTLDSDRHHIFCSLGREIQIEEFSLPSLPLPVRPNLTIVTCDKEIYFEKRDSVNLLIYDPTKAGSKIQLQLRQGSLVVSRLKVKLGDRGQGSVKLDPLPVGQYSVHRGGEKLCSFDVTAYSLAPLVGSLVEMVKEADNILNVSLKVESYGVPLQGGMWVSLRSGFGSKRTVFAMVERGELKARLELDEDAPYAIDLQHAERTELTATIPLPGSKASERVDVSLSALNPTWSVSMIAAKESLCSRGLHLTSGENSASPFSLERVDTRQARLVANVDASPLMVAVIDPLGDREPVVHKWESVKAGDSMEFELPAPLGVVCIGAFVSDQPWEATAMTVAPATLSCELFMPELVQAGAGFRIRAQTSSEAAVYFLVKDARLACRESPGDRLASKIMNAARSLNVDGNTGHVVPPNDDGRRFRLENLLEEIRDRGMLDEAQVDQARRLVRWTSRGVEEIIASVMGLSRTEFLSKVWGVEFAVLSDLDPELARLIPEDLARRYRCVPIGQRGVNQLLLAMADPRDVIAKDDISLITGFNIEPYLADDESIMRAINQQYGVTDLVEVEETVKDISAQDFGSMLFDDDIVALDRLRDSISPPPRNMVETFDGQPDGNDAEVIFAGWVKSQDGLLNLNLRAPSQPTEITVEAFAVGDLDWCTAEGSFTIQKDLIVELDLPPTMHPDDEIMAHLHIASGAPPFRVSVTHNGVALDVPEVVESRKPVAFVCGPGVYEARVEEIVSGKTETITTVVEQAGRLSGMRRTLQWLRKGDRLDKSIEPGILELKVLETADQPARALGRVTANYSHLCCEQTAAKILSACSLWVTAPQEKKASLESIIRAGIEREHSMFIPGEGLSMYPGGATPSDYWGPMAARYLCQLELFLSHGDSMSFGFRKMLAEAVTLGKQAAAAHGVQWPPTERHTDQECYLEMRFGENDSKLGKLLEEGQGQGDWGKVGERMSKCYRAAGLFRSGRNVPLAISLLNEVFKDLNEAGGLYSTADSIAAMCLFDELRLSEHSWSEPVVRQQSGEVISVYAEDGDTLVEVTRAFTEDWSELKPTVSLIAGLTKRVVNAGQSLKLNLVIPDGYQEGDLVWVSLPRSLSQLRGGGQVRRFSVDFEGKSELTLDLTAISPTSGDGETIMLCLRNMFLEERVALVEPVKVKVEALLPSERPRLSLPDSLRLADLTIDGLRGMPHTMGQLQSLSELIHHPDLVEFSERLLTAAINLEAQHLIFDWVDEGVARCRVRTADGLKEVVRFPAQVQAMLVGRLQMLSKNALGQVGAQDGEVSLFGKSWPVSIIPTSTGMMANLCMVKERPDPLQWLRVLSEIQQALVQDREPDLENLRRSRPGSNPLVDELLEMLALQPIPKQEALGLMARLASI